MQADHPVFTGVVIVGGVVVAVVGGVVVATGVTVAEAITIVGGALLSTSPAWVPAVERIPY